MPAAHDHSFARSRSRVLHPASGARCEPRALSLVTHRLEIRARVVPSPEPPFDRLFDPLVSELTRGGPLARQRFPSVWSDPSALSRLVEVKRAPLDAALA